MKQPINTNAAERALNQDIDHLKETGRQIANRVQKTKYSVDAPKRLIMNVRNNPAPFVMALGGILAIYGVVRLVNRQLRTMGVD